MKRFRTRRLWIRLFASLAFTNAFAGQQPAQSFDEYQVKAVFVFNFAQFVDWSPLNFESATSPFTICVLGDDPFGTILDETVRGETLGSRHFDVKRIASSTDARTCQIVFVSNSEARKLQPILQSLNGRSVLTVSDLDNFARRGGMVQLVKDNKRIKLAINIEAARAANLTISSKLLRPATIVTSGGD